jgi:hypothetical protein
MKRRVALRIVPRVRNPKTGDMPTGVAGESYEEAVETCRGCPLFNKGCYAHAGMVRGATKSMDRAQARNPSKYKSIALAIEGRSKAARLLRITAIGDAARVRRSDLRKAFKAARKAGLGVVGYTHFWRTDGADLRGMLMASVEGIEGFRAAVSAGWRAAATMPEGTEGTIRVEGVGTLVECPAIAAERAGKVFTCNDCAKGSRGALCDASTRTTAIGVYFAAHGSQRRALNVLQN